MIILCSEGIYRSGYQSMKTALSPQNVKKEVRTDQIRPECSRKQAFFLALFLKNVVFGGVIAFWSTYTNRFPYILCTRSSYCCRRSSYSWVGISLRTTPK